MESLFLGPEYSGPDDELLYIHYYNRISTSGPEYSGPDDELLYIH